MEYNEKREQLKSLLLDAAKNTANQLVVRGKDYSLVVRIKNRGIAVSFTFANTQFQYGQNNLTHIGFFGDEPRQVNIYLGDGPSSDYSGSLTKPELCIVGGEAKKYGKKLFNAFVMRINEEEKSKEENKLEEVIIKLSGFDEL